MDKIFKLKRPALRAFFYVHFFENKINLMRFFYYFFSYKELMSSEIFDEISSIFSISTAPNLYPKNFNT